MYIVNIINMRFSDIIGSHGLVLSSDDHRTNSRDPLLKLYHDRLQHLQESPKTPREQRQKEKEEPAVSAFS